MGFVALAGHDSSWNACVVVKGSMRSSYLSPSPPISGRDISALAVIRRPSWSGTARTGSYDGSSTTAGPQVRPSSRLSLCRPTANLAAAFACTDLRQPVPQPKHVHALHLLATAACWLSYSCSTSGQPVHFQNVMQASCVMMSSLRTGTRASGWTCSLLHQPCVFPQRFTTHVCMQAGHMGSPLQDSLDSSFFGSSAARQMLRPSSAAPYPLIGSKPLVLQSAGGCCPVCLSSNQLEACKSAS